jgi:hypothetical protein
MRAFWHLCLAMPDPMIFLALAGTTGLAVQLTRLMELARRPQHPHNDRLPRPGGITSRLGLASYPPRSCGTARDRRFMPSQSPAEPAA